MSGVVVPLLIAEGEERERAVVAFFGFLVLEDMMGCVLRR